MSALNEREERELRRFGWTLGPEFERRYMTDPWVFNLVKALGAVAQERDDALAAVPVPEPEEPQPECDCPWSGPLWSEKVNGSWGWQTCGECPHSAASVPSLEGEEMSARLLDAIERGIDTIAGPVPSMEPSDEGEDR